MKKSVCLALVLLSALSYVHSQDTSSLYNQAFNELDNLELKSNQQETIISGLLNSQSSEQSLLNNAEISLLAAEGRSISLEVSLQFYKKQTRVFIIALGVLGTLTIGEAAYILITR